MTRAKIERDLAAVEGTGDMIVQGLGSVLTVRTIVAGAGAGADLLEAVGTVGVIDHRIEGAQVVDTK